MGTPERGCGPTPSARVGGGRTSAGEHKGMSRACAPGPRAGGAEELLRSHLSPVLFSRGSTLAVSSECILRMARGLPPVESERE